MAWLRSCVLAIVLLSAGLGVRPAFGAIVTVEVEGVVDSVRLGGGIGLDGSVAIGSAMKGTCIYDSLTPDEVPSEVAGRYALIDISLGIGNYTFRADPASESLPYFEIGIVDPTYWTGRPFAVEVLVGDYRDGPRHSLGFASDSGLCFRLCWAP